MLKRRIIIAPDSSIIFKTGIDPLPETRSTPHSLIDLGKREPDPKDLQTHAPSRAPGRVLIDLGKRDPDPRDQPIPRPERGPSVPLIDLGKQPELPNPSAPPKSKIASLLFVTGGILALGGLGIWVSPLGRPQPSGAASNPMAAESATLPADTAALLQLTQLWQEYQDNLHHLIPNRDPLTPWWQGEKAGAASESQTVAVHQLQTDTLRNIDRLLHEAPLTDDSSYSLILDSIEHLKAQQTPPPVVLPPRQPVSPSGIQRLPQVEAPQLTQVPTRQVPAVFPTPTNPRL